jgi:8-amino-7-oxononanoate synthase
MNTQAAWQNPLAGKTLGGPASARLVIDGREYINFYGSGYLALSAVPKIRAAAMHALEAGVPFAQHVPAAVYDAIDPLFESVEQAAAAACGTEASVYFSSGYLIGIVGLASLAGSFDLVLLDEVVHYSLADAARLSGVPFYRFAHCDPDALRDILKRTAGAGQRPLVVTDGAFAVTGRVPPLKDYATVLAPYSGQLFVDEAHTFGVLGTYGRGAAELCDVEQIARGGATLSKAYCAQGAIVGCSAAVARRLRTTPQLRGACAGSPLSAAVAAASLRYGADNPRLRTRLHELTHYLRSQLRSVGFDVIESPAPIVSFTTGSLEDMRAIQRRVFEKGIHIIHATGYVGCDPEGVLRCTLFADHSHTDVDALISALR